MLHHSIRGDGDSTVFLLHGFLGSGRNLGTIARGWSRLDSTRRFVFVDLPGHGESPPLAPEATFDDAAQEILALVDHLGVSRPAHFVAHSLGGRMALAAALKEPEVAHRIDLIDIAPGPTEQLPVGDVVPVFLSAPARTTTREEMRDHLAQGGLPSALVDWLLMNLIREGDHFVWRIDREALAAFHRRTRGTDLWSALTDTRAVVRCFRGERSPYVSATDIARFSSLGVQVLTIEGAGHFVHSDAADRLVELLAQDNSPPGP